MLDTSRIHEAFLLLEDTRKKLLAFAVLTGNHIALRHIEEKYGEYFVADIMIGLGWQISKLGGKGVDIITQKSGKTINLEVKTSRFVRRFKRAKKGIAWAVTDTQWMNREFDRLVVVAMDFRKAPCAMLFSYDEVIRYFPLASFVRDNDPSHKLIKDYRRLDLCKKFSDWQYNMEQAKTTIKMKTHPTEFEVEFNKNPETIFDRYDFMRLSRGL